METQQMAALLTKVFFFSMFIMLLYGDLSPRQSLLLAMFTTAILCVVVSSLGINDDTIWLSAVILASNSVMLRQAYKAWKKQKASKLEIKN
jgi:hypothetical protein